MTHVLTARINQWAIERDLHNANSYKQLLKLSEEVGELCQAVTKNKARGEVKEEIGDIYVVLTILCLQLNLDIEDCIELAYDKIRDRKGKMINGIFVKESDLE